MPFGHTLFIGDLAEIVMNHGAAQPDTVRPDAGLVQGKVPGFMRPASLAHILGPGHQFQGMGVLVDKMQVAGLAAGQADDFLEGVGADFRIAHRTHLAQGQQRVQPLLVELDGFMGFDLFGDIPGHGVDEPLVHVGDGVPLEPAHPPVLAHVAVAEVLDGLALLEIVGDGFGGGGILRMHEGKPRNAEQFLLGPPQDAAPGGVDVPEVAVEIGHANGIDGQAEDPLAVLFRPLDGGDVLDDTDHAMDAARRGADRIVAHEQVPLSGAVVFHDHFIFHRLPLKAGIQVRLDGMEAIPADGIDDGGADDLLAGGVALFEIGFVDHAEDILPVEDRHHVVGGLQGQMVFA